MRHRRARRRAPSTAPPVPVAYPIAIVIRNSALVFTFPSRDLSSSIGSTMFASLKTMRRRYSSVVSGVVGWWHVHRVRACDGGQHGRSDPGGGRRDVGAAAVVYAGPPGRRREHHSSLRPVGRRDHGGRLLGGSAVD